jgi:hypothetical protein
MATRLYREIELLALDDPICMLAFFVFYIVELRYALGVVDPEEVRVQNRLYNTSDDGNRVPEDGCLDKVPPVDPIRDVQRPVYAQSEEVVGGDSLRLPRPL